MKTNTLHGKSRAFLLVIILLGRFIPCPCQGTGPRGTSSGFNSLQAWEIWSVSGNPAILGSVRSVILGTELEERYLLRELSSGSVGAAIPAFHGSFAAVVKRRGVQGYRETDLYTGYGREFSRIILAGLSFQYHRASAPGEYDKFHSISYRIGFIMRIGTVMQAGFSARNPFFPVRSVTPAEPALYQFGFLYSPGPGINISGGIDKEISRKTRIRLGCEIGRKDRFRAAIGLITSPGAVTVGAGVRLGSLLIDIAGVIHQFLGYYPQCSVEYRFRSS